VSACTGDTLCRAAVHEEGCFATARPVTTEEPPLTPRMKAILWGLDEGDLLRDWQTGRAYRLVDVKRDDERDAMLRQAAMILATTETTRWSPYDVGERPDKSLGEIQEDWLRLLEQMVGPQPEPAVAPWDETRPIDEKYADEVDVLTPDQKKSLHSHGLLGAGTAARLASLVEAVTRPPDGADMIVEERDRQVDEEGWTPEHDRRHGDEQLARAAAAYAMPWRWREMTLLNQSVRQWLWPRSWRFKSDVQPGLEGDEPVTTRVRDLVKAGALCAAEIDRLQRQLERE
jgi:hypothetical protein